jgi:hypothetical protein
MRILLLLLVALSGDACRSSDSWSELRGVIVDHSQTGLAGPVRLALLWYPDYHFPDVHGDLMPAAPVAAVTTQGPVRAGAYPQRYSFALDEPPPDAARASSSSSLGQGVAFGVLVAYEDLDSDGTLELDGFGGTAVDPIVGASMPDPSRPSAERSWLVVWAERFGDGSWESLMGLREGYNVLELEADSLLLPLPAGTDLVLPVTGDSALDLYACASAFGPEVSHFTTACGIDPYPGSYRSHSSLFNWGGSTLVQLEAYDGGGPLSGVSVSLDGAAVVVDGEATFEEATSLAADHQLVVTAPGHAPESMSFTMLDEVVVLSPTAGSTLRTKEPITVEWAPVPHADRYQVFVGSQGGSRNLYFVTADPFITLPAIDCSLSVTGSVGTLGSRYGWWGPCPAQIEIQLRAMTPIVVGAQGSTVQVESAGWDEFTVGL